jgi:hypothetical protein
MVVPIERIERRSTAVRSREAAHPKPSLSRDMRSLIVRVQIVLAVCVVGNLSPAADVSFLQSPLAGADGFLSEIPTDQNADNFSFVEKTKVNSVRWWGTYISSLPEPDQFTLRFFNAGAGIPQLNPSHEFTNLTVSRSDSGLLDKFGDTIYQYQAQIPTSVIVSAGSTAFISVLNTTVNGWFWQKSSNSGLNWFRFDDQDPWLSGDSGNLAFEVVAITPPPGDYDADFDVDNNDYNVWRRNFGLTGQSAADGNANGIVDAADYVVWRENLGTALGASASSAAVPEPTSLVLMLAGIFMTCARPVAP